jgi:hypothetical protein
MKNNVSGLFEIIWFVLGGLLLFMAVDVTMNTGLGDSWFYFLFSVLAFGMYFWRRRMRISRR